MTRKQILHRVLDYEKRVFYAETAFGDITDNWKLDLSVVGEYDVIYNHIITHKEFMQKKRNKEVRMADAVMSWYNTVYLPVVGMLKKRHIMRKFRKYTTADMYVWLIKYWDELKKKFGENVSLDTAAEELSSTYGGFSLKRLLNRIKYRLDLKK